MSSQWGDFLWGEGIWGSAEAAADNTLEASGLLTLSGTADLRDRPAINMSASGSLPLTGSASLQLAVLFAASGSLLLSSSAALTTVIQMIAAGDLVLDGSGRLRVARNATRLHQCGDPLSTACSDWMP